MTKLYVGNLAYSASDESLLQLFTGRGYKAVSAGIITDPVTGRSRGFGFVELAPEDDATKAIGEFNGLDVGGRASGQRSSSARFWWWKPVAKRGGIWGRTVRPWGTTELLTLCRRD